MGGGLIFMKNHLKKSTITGVFIMDEEKWGEIFQNDTFRVGQIFNEFR